MLSDGLTMAGDAMTICHVLDDLRPEKSGCQSRKMRSMVGLGHMAKGQADGYSEALGQRLSHAIERGGGVLAVAKALEVSKDTPARWRDGLSKISLYHCERLAEIADVDPAWLAFGSDPNRLAVDYDLVQEAAETVIEVAAGLGKEIDATALARTIRSRAERLAQDRQREHATLLTPSLNRG